MSSTPPAILIPGEYAENIQLESPRTSPRSDTRDSESTERFNFTISEEHEAGPLPRSLSRRPPSIHLSTENAFLTLPSVIDSSSNSEGLPSGRLFSVEIPADLHPDTGTYDSRKRRSRSASPEARGSRSRSHVGRRDALLTPTSAATASNVFNEAPNANPGEFQNVERLGRAPQPEKGNKRRVASPASSRYASPRQSVKELANTDTEPEYMEPDIAVSDLILPVASHSFKAWGNLDAKLRRHDKRLVKAWKEEIDNILVFAGLFSAVLTAFIVESYKLLKPDSEDSMLFVLGQISILLNSTTVIETPPADLSVPVYAVRVNILWFTSLVFGLSAASIGILVKQWLRNYISSTQPANSPQENARIRQFRHQGFTEWRVPEVIAFLPILLQIGLALFFIGLVDLLWKLNVVVAGVVTVFVTASLSFVVVTTITPSFSQHCPHKSPQSLAVYRLKSWLTANIMAVLIRMFPIRLRDGTFSLMPVLVVSKRHRWAARLRLRFMQYANSRPPRTWREREKNLMQQNDKSLPHELDGKVLTNADLTFMEDRFLIQVIGRCFHELPATTWANSLEQIISHRASYLKDGTPTWRVRAKDEPLDTGLFTLILLLTQAIPKLPKDNPKRVAEMLAHLEQICYAFQFSNEDVNCRKAFSHVLICFTSLLSEDHNEENDEKPAQKKTEDHKKMEEEIRQLAYNKLFTTIMTTWEQQKDVDVDVLEQTISFCEAARERGDLSTCYGACMISLRLFMDGFRGGLEMEFGPSEPDKCPPATYSRIISMIEHVTLALEWDASMAEAARQSAGPQRPPMPPRSDGYTYSSIPDLQHTSTLTAIIPAITPLLVAASEPFGTSASLRILDEPRTPGRNSRNRRSNGSAVLPHNSTIPSTTTPQTFEVPDSVYTALSRAVTELSDYPGTIYPRLSLGPRVNALMGALLSATRHDRFTLQDTIGVFKQLQVAYDTKSAAAQRQASSAQSTSNTHLDHIMRHSGSSTLPLSPSIKSRNPSPRPPYSAPAVVANGS